MGQAIYENPYHYPIIRTRVSHCLLFFSVITVMTAENDPAPTQH